MDYRNFIKQIPAETKKLIHNAIDIYMKIKEKELNYHINGELVVFSEQDKKCISLFLAGLVTDSKAKEYMIKNGIDSKYFYGLLNINDEDLKKEDVTDYEKIFNFSFKELINKIVTDYYMHFDENLSNLHSHNIILALILKDVSNSEIIKHTFIEGQFLGKGKAISYHTLFLDLQKEAYKKRRQGSAEKVYKEHQERNEEIRKAMLSLNTEKTDLYGEYLTNKKGLSFFDHRESLDAIMIQLLSEKRGALLISDDPYEKDAVINDLVYLIGEKKVPNRLQNVRVFKLNMTSFISNTAYRGELEARVKALAKSIISNGNQKTAIYVDNMYQTLSYSGNENSLSLWSLLIPYMEKIKIIGGITKQEYLRSVGNNAEIKSKFALININEPSTDELEKAIVKIIGYFSKEKKINFPFPLEQRKKISSLLAECTQRIHQAYDDKETNPTLAISIIEDAFNYAIIDNSDHFKIDHLVKAINQKGRIYESTRLNCIFKLRQLFNIPVNEKDKIIVFPGRAK